MTHDHYLCCVKKEHAFPSSLSRKSAERFGRDNYRLRNVMLFLGTLSGMAHVTSAFNLGAVADPTHLYSRKSWPLPLISSRSRRFPEDDDEEKYPLQYNIDEVQESKFFTSSDSQPLLYHRPVRSKRATTLQVTGRQNAFSEDFAFTFLSGIVLSLLFGLVIYTLLNNFSSMSSSPTEATVTNTNGGSNSNTNNNGQLAALRDSISILRQVMGRNGAEMAAKIALQSKEGASPILRTPMTDIAPNILGPMPTIFDLMEKLGKASSLANQFTSLMGLHGNISISTATASTTPAPTEWISIPFGGTFIRVPLLAANNDTLRQTSDNEFNFPLTSGTQSASSASGTGISSPQQSDGGVHPSRLPPLPDLNALHPTVPTLRPPPKRPVFKKRKNEVQTPPTVSSTLPPVSTMDSYEPTPYPYYRPAYLTMESQDHTPSPLMNSYGRPPSVLMNSYDSPSTLSKNSSDSPSPHQVNSYDRLIFPIISYDSQSSPTMQSYNRPLSSTTKSYDPLPSPTRNSYFHPPSPQINTYERPPSPQVNSYERPSPPSINFNDRPPSPPRNSSALQPSRPVNSYDRLIFPPIKSYESKLSPTTESYDRPPSLPTESYDRLIFSPKKSHESPPSPTMESYDRPLTTTMRSYFRPPSPAMHSHFRPPFPTKPALLSPVTAPIIATRPTVPTFRPTVPLARPTVPTARPTNPTTRPTVPTARPTNPATRPTVPTFRPTVPTARPTVPTARPTVAAESSEVIIIDGEFLRITTEGSQLIIEPNLPPSYDGSRRLPATTTETNELMEAIPVILPTTMSTFPMTSSVSSTTPTPRTLHSITIYENKLADLTSTAPTPESLFPARRPTLTSKMQSTRSPLEKGIAELIEVMQQTPPEKAHKMSLMLSSILSGLNASQTDSLEESANWPEPSITTLEPSTESPGILLTSLPFSLSNLRRHPTKELSRELSLPMLSKIHQILRDPSHRHQAMFPTGSTVDVPTRELFGQMPSGPLHGSAFTTTLNPENDRGTTDFPILSNLATATKEPTSGSSLLPTASYKSHTLLKNFSGVWAKNSKLDEVRARRIAPTTIHHFFDP